MNQIEALEKVLDYLSLEEVIKLRVISLGCRDIVDNFRTKTLCYSEQPRGFIYASSQLINGAFVQNFIHSTRFASFFRTFGPSILSELKHLRFCHVRLSREDGMAFNEVLNSFRHLEVLDLIHLDLHHGTSLGSTIQLNLPVLNSILTECLGGIRRLNLDTPKLRNVKIGLGQKLNIIHVESVEKVIAYDMDNLPVKNLKNLKYLCSVEHCIDSTFLSSLDQLKEIHLNDRNDIATIFEQKQRYGRTDLKVYLYGCLLSGPDSPLLSIRDYLQWSRSYAVAAEDPARLADEIPWDNLYPYSAIEQIAPELQASFVNRFTNLNHFIVNRPVQNVQHFLDLLKNSGSITSLGFESDQPQDLFDRLPEHCTGLQYLTYKGALTDFQFLARLYNLRSLCLHCAMNAEWIRSVLELPFLWEFRFSYNNKWFALSNERNRFGITNGQPERFGIIIDGNSTNVVGLNAAYQLIFGNAAEG